MLSIRTRQIYLKALGLYDGAIDGKEGPKTRAAYKALQNRYFVRKEDRDGKYGPDTDILLRSAYNCRDLKYFKLEEFRCKCGHCTGYPAVVNRQLVLNLDKMRARFGRINITSGLRCKWKNDRLKGSSKTSRHLSGKAVDFHVGLAKKTSGRKTVIAYWYKQSGARYSYANIGGNHPNMGTAVHCDVK